MIHHRCIGIKVVTVVRERNITNTAYATVTLRYLVLLELEIENPPFSDGYHEARKGTLCAHTILKMDLKNFLVLRSLRPALHPLSTYLPHHASSNHLLRRQSSCGIGHPFFFIALVLYLP